MPPFQIYSDSTGTIDIQGTTFTSNAVSEKGGAVYAVGTEKLSITGSTFTDNKVGPGEEQDAAGGDIYAGTEVEVTIGSSTFTGSQAEYGGAAIECCGGTITTSTFSNTATDMTSVSLIEFEAIDFYACRPFASVSLQERKTHRGKQPKADKRIFFLQDGCLPFFFGCSALGGRY